MFNSSCSFTQPSQIIVSDSIEYFDDHDLSSLQFRILIGVVISFVFVLAIFAALIFYYEIFIKNQPTYQEEIQRRLQTFQEFAGLHTESNDLHSILMNEFILEAWKREKNRRERHD